MSVYFLLLIPEDTTLPPGSSCANGLSLPVCQHTKLTIRLRVDHYNCIPFRNGLLPAVVPPPYLPRTHILRPPPPPIATRGGVLETRRTPARDTQTQTPHATPPRPTTCYPRHFEITRRTYNLTISRHEPQPPTATFCHVLAVPPKSARPSPVIVTTPPPRVTPRSQSPHVQSLSTVPIPGGDTHPPRDFTPHTPTREPTSHRETPGHSHPRPVESRPRAEPLHTSFLLHETIGPGAAPYATTAPESHLRLYPSAGTRNPPSLALAYPVEYPHPAVYTQPPSRARSRLRHLSPLYPLPAPR
ncbi:hypothetical protein CRENBAI_007208 [Crenichthys baileyi]|uniref:Uncharacterized protein n=1 Tax=Crenichthys baileyi TaxID=28760 RepID=A0AAV9RKD0_9TELE